MSKRSIEIDVKALKIDERPFNAVGLDDALRTWRADAAGEARSPGAYLRSGVEPPPVLAPVSSEGFLVVDPIPGRGEGIDSRRLGDHARAETRRLFRNAHDLDRDEARAVLAEREGSA